MTLAEEVGRNLRERKLTLAVAESASGGLISTMITDIAGSSDYFRGGVVSYDNDIKIKVLGVNQETLELYGAVSPQTAAEMASGVRLLMNTSIGISDTGIAGPAGETPGKPVGLFYLGISTSIDTHTEEHLFQGNRLENRLNAARAALQMLLNYLKRSR